MGVYAMEGQLNPLFQPEYHMLADLYFLALFASLSPARCFSDLNSSA